MTQSLDPNQSMSKKVEELSYFRGLVEKHVHFIQFNERKKWTKAHLKQKTKTSLSFYAFVHESDDMAYSQKQLPKDYKTVYIKSQKRIMSRLSLDPDNLLIIALIWNIGFLARFCKFLAETQKKKSVMQTLHKPF